MKNKWNKMSFIIGAVIGIAFGVGIIVTFLKSEKASSKQRIHLASGGFKKDIHTSTIPFLACVSQNNKRAMINLHGADKGEIEYMSQNLNDSATYQDSARLVIKGQDIELERISTIMTAIDLSSNHFEGVIPKAIKDLGSLWLLNLSHNNFTGYIPTELGQLNTLEVLDLSWNRLIGKIPRELTRVKFLAVLNLSQNLLVGRIPQGSQFNTFSKDSYGGNLDLCGPPLSKQCGTSDSSHVPPPLESKEEEESYFLSGFTWESVVIGYSCGLVVGTVMWSLMFKARKPKWVVEFLEGAFPKKMRRAQERRLKDGGLQIWDF